MYVPNHMVDSPWQPYYSIWSHTSSNDGESEMSVYSPQVSGDMEFTSHKTSSFKMRISWRRSTSCKLVTRKKLTLAISKGFREHHFINPRRTLSLSDCDTLSQGKFWKRQFDRINSVATGHSNTDCNIRTFHCCLYLPSSGPICKYCYLCNVITKIQPQERYPTDTVLPV